MNRITTLRVNDKISFADKYGMGITIPSLKSGLWAKTEVIGGYGDVVLNPTGKSTLSETCFEQHNTVPIGGVQYAMELLFGNAGTQFDVPTMYSANGIGSADSLAPTETYKTPDGVKSIVYRYGHLVQLFGIGVTGTAENDVTVYPVDYRENNVTLSKVSSDGATIKGTMLPFRYTSETLSSADRKTYFGKKVDDEGITGYYLKRFETDPVIKHIWKTGEDVDDESLVSSDDVWSNASGLNAVESFTEIVLKIGRKDVKEWFTALDQYDRSRVNTLALFNGRYVVDETNAADYGDYEDVRLFSKLNIPVEYLSLNKDLNIIYRVYGA